MKVISTNLAQARDIEWNGKVIQTGIFKEPIDQPIYLGELGVEGDTVANKKAHGGEDKACYLFGSNHYPYWQKKYANLPWVWGMFGENITVSGLDEQKIHIGDVFEIGESVVKVTQPRLPCYKLGVRFNDQKIVKEFLHSGHCGVYVKVLKAGAVKQGDSMYLAARQSKNLSLAEVFGIYRSKDKDLIDIALLDKDLAESIRKDLIRFRKKE